MFDEVTILRGDSLFSRIVSLGKVHDADWRRVFLEHSSEMLSCRHTILINVLVQYDVRLGLQWIGDLCPEEGDRTTNLDIGAEHRLVAL